MIALNNDLIAIYFISKAFQRQEEKKLSLSLVGSCKNQGNARVFPVLRNRNRNHWNCSFLSLAVSDLDPDPT